MQKDQSFEMGKVCQFYSGKNVFVTGGTGFCGKVLVEKLLRSCETIGTIFILVRRKKNVSPKDRYIDYVNNLVFSEVRQKNADLMRKIVFIGGDITIDGMELSQQDRELLIESVNIVFHCAANVRFNDTLKSAININVTGTWRILRLAEKMRNLKVFLYISTAFCQSYQEDLDEKYYPSKLSAFSIIAKTQACDEKTLKGLEKELLATSKHPNTYTLSKALAEDVVYSYHKAMPIVIMRPSIVWYSAEHPFKGYVEGMNSGIAIIAGGMTGTIRSIYAGEKSTAKATPVDYLASATIASGWQRSIDLQSEPLFYNCTDAVENSMLWNQSFKMGKDSFLTYPPYEKIMWYPNMSFTSSYTWHVLSICLFQILPAMLMDACRLLAGKKAMFTRLQSKIVSGIHPLSYFTIRNFQFDTKRLRELYNGLDDEDKRKFYFDHTTIDWKDYHKHGVRQIRRLLLKEDDSTILQGRSFVRKLFYLDLLVKASFGLLFAFLLTKTLQVLVAQVF